ncbi:hypothetical protein EVAR_97421_1 [Eumeta japonica]|uniref:Uncharacterized protein n=1 Tax=Eumeta variegata TaxID=151549 RepID=A0A4C1WYP9_EUMVA|nr:hypothetical protein EVAR_97421_1 [Eumeta japonica]
MLHHDNAPPHSSAVTVNFLKTLAPDPFSPQPPPGSKLCAGTPARAAPSSDVLLVTQLGPLYLFIWVYASETGMAVGLFEGARETENASNLRQFFSQPMRSVG